MAICESNKIESQVVDLAIFVESGPIHSNHTLPPHVEGEFFIFFVVHLAISLVSNAQGFAAFLDEFHRQ